jgi:hypothetical protein
VPLDISPHLPPAAVFFSARLSSPVGRISGSKLIRKLSLTPTPKTTVNKRFHPQSGSDSIVSAKTFFFAFSKATFAPLIFTKHPETIHFGVDTDQPENISTYYKELRKLDGTLSGIKTALHWKNGSSSRRTLDIAALADVEKATNSAEFGVTMIEGVGKVRFIKAGAPLS